MPPRKGNKNSKAVPFNGGAAGNTNFVDDDAALAAAIAASLAMEEGVVIPPETTESEPAPAAAPPPVNAWGGKPSASVMAPAPSSVAASTSPPSASAVISNKKGNAAANNSNTTTARAPSNGNAAAAPNVSNIVATSIVDGSLTADDGYDSQTEWVSGSGSEEGEQSNHYSSSTDASANANSTNTLLLRALYRVDAPCERRNEEKLHSTEVAVPTAAMTMNTHSSSSSSTAAVPPPPPAPYAPSCTCLSSPTCLCGFRSKLFGTPNPTPQAVTAFVKKQFLQGLHVPRVATMSAVEGAIGEDLCDWGDALGRIAEGNNDADDATIADQQKGEGHHMSAAVRRYHPLVSAMLAKCGHQSAHTATSADAVVPFAARLPSPTVSPFAMTSRGLRNMSCNCYFNAIIQCLFQIPEARTSIMLNASPLRKALWENNTQTKGDVVVATSAATDAATARLANLGIASLFANMLYSSAPVIDTHEAVVNGLGIDPTIQQDAQEFLGLLLTTLGDMAPAAPVTTSTSAALDATPPSSSITDGDVNGSSSMPIDGALPAPLFDLKKLLQTTFVTQQLYKRQCGNCRHTTFRADSTPFMTLSCATSSSQRSGGGGGWDGSSSRPTVFMDEVNAKAARFYAAAAAAIASTSKRGGGGAKKNGKKGAAAAVEGEADENDNATAIGQQQQQHRSTISPTPENPLSTMRTTGILTRRQRKALEDLSEQQAFRILSETRRSPEVLDVDRILKNDYNKQNTAINKKKGGGTGGGGNGTSATTICSDSSDYDEDDLTAINVIACDDDDEDGGECALNAKNKARRFGFPANAVNVDDVQAVEEDEAEFTTNKSSSPARGATGAKSGKKAAPPAKKSTPQQNAKKTATAAAAPPAAAAAAADTIALEDAILTLLAPERIDGYRCEACNSATINNADGSPKKASCCGVSGNNGNNAAAQQRPMENYLSSQLLLKKLPTTLVFHLNRFSYDFMTGDRKKNHCAVNFPEILDVNAVTNAATMLYAEEGSGGGEAPPTAAAAAGPTGRNLYRLSGIVNHIGNSPHGGHYTYYGSVPIVVHDDNNGRHQYKWVKYDDNTVSDLPKRFSAHERLQSRDPYLLVYRRVDDAVAAAHDEAVAERAALEAVEAAMLAANDDNDDGGVKKTRANQQRHVDTDGALDPSLLPMILNPFNAASSPSSSPQKASSSSVPLWPLFVPADLLLPTLRRNEGMLLRHSFFDALRKDLVGQVRSWLQLANTIVEHNKAYSAKVIACAGGRVGGSASSSSAGKDEEYRAVPEQWLADFGHMFLQWESSPAARIAGIVAEEKKALEDKAAAAASNTNASLNAAMNPTRRRTAAVPWDEEEVIVDRLMAALKGTVVVKGSGVAPPLGDASTASARPSNSTSNKKGGISGPSSGTCMSDANTARLGAVAWSLGDCRIVSEANFAPLLYTAVVAGGQQGKSTTDDIAGGATLSNAADKKKKARTEGTAAASSSSPIFADIPSRFTDGLLCPHQKLIPFYYNAAVNKSLQRKNNNNGDDSVADSSSSPSSSLTIKYTHRYKLVPLRVVKAMQAWYDAVVTGAQPLEAVFSNGGDDDEGCDDAAAISNAITALDDDDNDTAALPSLPSTTTTNNAAASNKKGASTSSLVLIPRRSFVPSAAAERLCPLALKGSDFEVAAQRSGETLLRMGDPADTMHGSSCDNKRNRKSISSGACANDNNSSSSSPSSSLVCIPCSVATLRYLREQRKARQLERAVKASSLLFAEKIAATSSQTATATGCGSGGPYHDPNALLPLTQPLSGGAAAGKKKARDDATEDNNTCSRQGSVATTQPLGQMTDAEAFAYYTSAAVLGGGENDGSIPLSTTTPIDKVAYVPTRFLQWWRSQPFAASDPEHAYRHFIGMPPPPPNAAAASGSAAAAGSGKKAVAICTDNSSSDGNGGDDFMANFFSAMNDDDVEETDNANTNNTANKKSSSGKKGGAKNSKGGGGDAVSAAPGSKRIASTTAAFNAQLATINFYTSSLGRAALSSGSNNNVTLPKAVPNGDYFSAVVGTTATTAAVAGLPPFNILSTLLCASHGRMRDDHGFPSLPLPSDDSHDNKKNSGSTAASSLSFAESSEISAVPIALVEYLVKVRGFECFHFDKKNANHHTSGGTSTTMKLFIGDATGGGVSLSSATATASSPSSSPTTSSSSSLPFSIPKCCKQCAEADAVAFNQRLVVKEAKEALLRQFTAVVAGGIPQCVLSVLEDPNSAASSSAAVLGGASGNNVVAGSQPPPATAFARSIGEMHHAVFSKGYIGGSTANIVVVAPPPTAATSAVAADGEQPKNCRATVTVRSQIARSRAPVGVLTGNTVDAAAAVPAGAETADYSTAGASASSSSTSYNWLVDLLLCHRFANDVNKAALKKDIGGYTKSYRKAWQKHYPNNTTSTASTASTSNASSTPAPPQSSNANNNGPSSVAAAAAAAFPDWQGATYFTIPTLWCAIVQMWARNDALELPIRIPPRYAGGGAGGGAKKKSPDDDEEDDNANVADVTMGAPADSNATAEDDEPPTLRYSERLRRRLRENWFNAWDYVTALDARRRDDQSEGSSSTCATAGAPPPYALLETDDLHPVKCVPTFGAAGGPPATTSTAAGTENAASDVPLGLDLALLLRTLSGRTATADPLLETLLQAPMLLSTPAATSTYATTVPPLTMVPLELLPAFIDRLDGLSSTTLKGVVTAKPTISRLTTTVTTAPPQPAVANGGRGAARAAASANSAAANGGTPAIPPCAHATLGSAAAINDASGSLAAAWTHSWTARRNKEALMGGGGSVNRTLITTTANSTPPPPQATTTTGASKSAPAAAPPSKGWGATSNAAAAAPAAAASTAATASAPPTAPLLPALKCKLDAAALLHESLVASASFAANMAGNRNNKTATQSNKEAAASVVFALDTVPLFAAGGNAAVTQFVDALFECYPSSEKKKAQQQQNESSPASSASPSAPLSPTTADSSSAPKKPMSSAAKARMALLTAAAGGGGGGSGASPSASSSTALPTVNITDNTDLSSELPELMATSACASSLVARAPLLTVSEINAERAFAAPMFITTADSSSSSSSANTATAATTTTAHSLRQQMCSAVDQLSTTYDDGTLFITAKLRVGSSSSSASAAAGGGGGKAKSKGGKSKDESATTMTTNNNSAVGGDLFFVELNDLPPMAHSVPLSISSSTTTVGDLSALISAHIRDYGHYAVDGDGDGSTNNSQLLLIFKSKSQMNNYIKAFESGTLSGGGGTNTNVVVDCDEANDTATDDNSNSNAVVVVAAGAQSNAAAPLFLSAQADGHLSLAAAGIRNHSTLHVALLFGTATRLAMFDNKANSRKNRRREGGGGGGGRVEADAFGNTKLGGFGGYDDDEDGDFSSGEDEDGDENDNAAAITTGADAHPVAKNGATATSSAASPGMDDDMAAAIAASLAFEQPTSAAVAAAEHTTTTASGKKNKKGKSPAASSSAAAAAAAVKECPICTFHNKGSAKFCEMCESPLV